MLALKRNQSSDTNIHGDVNTIGDAAIGGNAKIIKTPKENKCIRLLGILSVLVTVIVGVIEIYKFYIGK